MCFFYCLFAGFFSAISVSVFPYREIIIIVLRIIIIIIIKGSDLGGFSGET